MKEGRIQKKAEIALKGRISVLNKDQGGEHRTGRVGKSNANLWVREAL